MQQLQILIRALEYIEENEAFTRTFRQVWNMTPSEFKKTERSAILFPQYTGYTEIGKGGGRRGLYVSVVKLNGSEMAVIRVYCF